MDYWEQMVTEERRCRARELGIRLCDLEEIERFDSALAESKMEESRIDPSAPSAPTRLADSTEGSRDAVSREEEPVDGEVRQGLRSGAWQQERHDRVDVEEKEDGSEEEKDYLPSVVAAEEPRVVVASTSAAPVEQGPWIHLPVELLDKILFFLGDPDMFGYLAMASKSVFHPNERCFRFLCELIYSRQTARGALGLGKWSSWRSMLIHRPRLRTNGFYSLRTTFTKQHCHDAFWEEQIHECIEVKYYRLFRFFDHGRVLYCLDITGPREMAAMMQSGQPIPKRLYEGTYRLQRNHLSVQVMLHYCQMMFDLIVVDGDDGYVGKHNMLTLLSHTSRTKEGLPLATYPIPTIANFRFHREWSYNAQHPGGAKHFT